ncbi:hypothetical protein EVAR_41504_1 [Eumeta japonica]|uniref:Uncharacterized protein n=1 Tax=Eumeta variegata TaxID=151549 RepID=A0A4C1X6H6_EUMVA|nr:hypothetical protein EVAR_41504_1 [Eumeta japonica]
MVRLDRFRRTSSHNLVSDLFNVQRIGDMIVDTVFGKAPSVRRRGPYKSTVAPPVRGRVNYSYCANAPTAAPHSLTVV